MARFGSTVAFFVGGRKYKAGQTYADTAGNALAGDVVWVGMSSQTMSPGLIPLDGPATTMKSASVHVGKQVNLIDGANSIE
jgi:hypothetical protein